MIIGFTGHRKLDHPKPAIIKQLKSFLSRMGPSKTISGMALGFDQLAAYVSIKLNIPFIAALPSRIQSRYWNEEQQERYEKLLKRANEVVYIDELPEYQMHNSSFVDKCFKRNEWIADHCDKMIAYYNATVKRSGTMYTIMCAQQQHKIVIFLPVS